MGRVFLLRCLLRVRLALDSALHSVALLRILLDAALLSGYVKGESFVEVSTVIPLHATTSFVRTLDVDVGRVTSV